MYARQSQAPAARPAAVNSMPDHDPALVAALVAGDESAWRTFHSVYSGCVLDAIGHVRSRFPSLMGPDDVRDIYADLCLQLLVGDKRRLRQFDSARGTSLSAWLNVLARHAAYDFLRNRRRHPLVRWRGEETTRHESMLEAAPDPFGLYCSRERARLVASSIETLSPRDREFVEVYFCEGLDPERTAERLGICVGTVYSKKHKIRARIESLLGQRLAARGFAEQRQTAESEEPAHGAGVAARGLGLCSAAPGTRAPGGGDHRVARLQSGEPASAALDLGGA